MNSQTTSEDHNRIQHISEEEISSELSDTIEELSAIQKKIEEQRAQLGAEVKIDNTDKSYMQAMLDAGFRGETLVTTKETFRRITTEKRLEILKTLAENEIESAQELADKVGRDHGNLSRDLEILFKEGMIEYEREGNKKKPILKHTRIVSEPVEIS